MSFDDDDRRNGAAPPFPAPPRELSTPEARAEFVAYWQAVETHDRAEGVGKYAPGGLGDPHRPTSEQDAAELDAWRQGIDAERRSWERRGYGLNGSAAEATPEQEREQADADRHAGQSWRPVDLSAHVAGTYVPPVAELELIADVPLLYRGEVHWLYGEAESAKSWLAQIAVARALAAGLPVLYVDYESNAGAVVDRLRLLGVDDADLLPPLDDPTAPSRFVYLNPEHGPRHPIETEAVDELLDSAKFALIIIDGVTVAHGLDAIRSNDTDEMARWCREYPTALALRTGAAVACIDHVTKDKDGRGRFPIGSQAKLNAVTGAAYSIVPTTPLAPGRVGVVQLWVAKDRPSAIRAAAGPPRSGGTFQLYATVRIDARDPASLAVTVEGGKTATAAGSGSGTGAAPGGEWRPTRLMEKSSRVIESEGDSGITSSGVSRTVQARKDYVGRALDVLAAEGWVQCTVTTRGAVSTHAYRSRRPYREATDPALGGASS